MSRAVSALGWMTALGVRTATVPLKVMGSLAEPVRSDIGRDVRRALGLPEVPLRRVTDPADAFLHPQSVARRVHSDL
ncbi:MAG: hypothetical protein ABSE98_14875, partial [Acidimicrobiales bacterium]